MEYQLTPLVQYVALYYLYVVTYQLARKYADFSKCLCEFSTGVFGIQNYSGFNRDRWTNVKATLITTSKTAKSKKPLFWSSKIAIF